MISLGLDNITDICFGYDACLMKASEGQSVGSTNISKKIDGASRVPLCGTKDSKSLRYNILFLMMFLAFIVRLVYVYETSGVPFVQHPVGDAAGYVVWAKQIAEGDWIGSQSFYQAPLYPYVLGAIFSIFHSEVWFIRFVQALWGALAVGLLACAAARLFNLRSGIVAGLMLTFYAPAIFFDGIMQKASLGCFLICGMLWLLVWIRNCVRWYAFILLGLSIGLLTLTRENALIWAVFLGVWVLVTFGQGDQTKRYQYVFFYIFGVTIALFPVALRNKTVGGEWSLTTFQSGSNFYIGNHSGASGLYEPMIRGHETPMFERIDTTNLAQQATGQNMTPREVSQYWMQRAWDDISQDPISWLKLFVRKNLMVWNRYEISDAEGLIVYARSSWVLSVLGRVCHFGMLVPLALVGVTVTWSDRKNLWWLYGLVVTMAVSIAMFFVLARYRFVLVPLLIPLAAVGCVTVWERWRAAGVSRRFSWVVSALLAATVVNWPVHHEGRLNAIATMNAGVALASRGDVEGAMEYFELAVVEYPESAEANNNLAQALALTGDFERAMEHYQRALASELKLMGVDYNLGVALEQLGRVDEALKHYLRAIELDSGDVEAKDAIDRLRK